MLEEEVVGVGVGSGNWVSPRAHRCRLHKFARMLFRHLPPRFTVSEIAIFFHEKAFEGEAAISLTTPSNSANRDKKQSETNNEKNIYIFTTGRYGALN